MAMDPTSLGNHLHSLGLNISSREQVLAMAVAPSKDVERGALDNVVVRHYSCKNMGVVSVASHTVERLCALELELDPAVLAYYPQARCVGIERRGGTHVSSGTVDFMAIRRDGVRLIECKPASSIAKLIEQNPDEWSVCNGQVTRPAYADWAERRSLSFEVWVSPSRVGPYLANLQLVYAVKIAYCGSAPGPIADRALALIRKRPRTIRELTTDNERFTAEMAVSLIGDRRAFGPLRVVPLDDIASFTLFASEEQSNHAEKLAAKVAEDATSQCNDALSVASETDIKRATQRLAIVDQFLQGRVTPPRHWAELARSVVLARSRGESALGACLTEYSKSGNRLPRLAHEQTALMREVMGSHWDTGVAGTLGALHAQLELRSEQSGTRAPSRKTLGRFIAQHSQVKRQLAVGGVRNYQANKVASDPRVRSMDAIARHLVLEIDSTKCDNRCFSSLYENPVLDTPLLYVGLDGCTHEAMAHAFVFGPARTDGVALLLRDYVRRHGRLPHEIRIDRASENTCGWMRDFCAYYRIALVILPTGGSRYKGDLENMLGRVNSQVAHALLGSTLPDQAGRSVDGKFKSYYTALHQFETVQEQIEICLHRDFQITPAGDGVTPEEKRAVSAANFPTIGNLQKLDEDFLFQTSVPVRARAFDQKKGLRTGGQAFISDELLAAMPTSEISAVRRDVWDPSLLRLQLTSGRVRAWSRLTTKVAHSSQMLKQFHLLFSAQRMARAIEVRERIRIERYHRTAAANSAAQAACSDLGTNSGVDSDEANAHIRSDLSFGFHDVDDLVVTQ